MTVEIPLTRGLIALVDDTDAELVLQFKWCVKPGKKTFYAVRRMLVAEGQGRRLQSMHRFLTSYPLTDHINGDGLDNRRSNLRAADDLSNLRNMRKRQGASRFKGVSWHKSSKRWYARIRSGYAIHLGSFTDEVAAAPGVRRSGTCCVRRVRSLGLPGAWRTVGAYLGSSTTRQKRPRPARAKGASAGPVVHQRRPSRIW